MKKLFFPFLMRLRFRKIPLYFLGILVLNLFFSPVVQASTGGLLSRSQFYALGLLSLVTFSLFIYLFIVILQPEKF